MKKNWTLSMLAFAAMVAGLAMTSCKDKNSEEEPPAPPPTSIDLPKAYADLDPDGEKAVRLIFSDYEAEFIEGFSGEGHCISLMIQAPGMVSLNRILQLPEGNYAFGGEELKLIESQRCGYSETGKNPVSSPFVSGSMSVVEKEESRYDITGELVCADRTTRKFSYRGIIPVDPGTAPSS